MDEKMETIKQYELSDVEIHHIINILSTDEDVILAEKVMRGQQKRELFNKLTQGDE